MADLLALKGDAMDNIPGAPGIGEKGARDLIEQFGSVDGGARPGGRGDAEDVPREPAEQSRADPDEPEAGDDRLRRSGGFRSGACAAAGAGRGRLKPLYKELEFFSHLKELGPSEDARARDFASLEDLAGYSVDPEGARLAVTFTREPMETGLSCRAGEAGRFR